MKILVVEDELKLARAIKQGLELNTWAVDLARDGQTGLDMALEESDYDILIVDVMLPQVNGIELCQRLRASKITTPILMLTALGQLQDKINGLDSGADDYLVKPFAFEELFARIRALLRRPTAHQDPVLKIADLTLDPASFQVKRGALSIELSAREFAILEFLMRNSGKVISKEQIIAHVWNFDADILPGTVEVHLKHIRDKLDKPFSSKLIQTVRGFGYQIQSDKNHV